MSSDDVWRGPARVIGSDNRVIWVMHNGMPVATATHLMRPVTTSEVLAYSYSSRDMTPFDPHDPGRARRVGEQQGYIDAT